MPIVSARGWQVHALKKFINHDQSVDGAFLLEACPGAGKTIFSALAAKEILDEGSAQFILIVVPTTALKGDSKAGFLGDWNKAGVQLTTTMKSKSGPPPKGFHGAVITYAQLANIVGVIEMWVKTGIDLMIVFDEVHHASEENTWGSSADAIGSIAKYVLAMTGTPFRGDGKEISFVTYRDDKAVPHYKYTYRQAVADKVCRQIFFAHDNGVADYVFNNEREQVRISEADQTNTGKAAAAVFHHESSFLRAVLQKAEAKLDEYDSEGRPYKAGGIVICRPGSDENDDRHLMQVARTLKRITGEMPIVITHDDPDANIKIEKFRDDDSRWICSVRKISEGVDIKRLRVEVLASVPGTELLFRQLVGRVVRVIDKENTEDATVFMARFSHLEEWAKRIEDEAKAGLRDKLDREREASEKERGESSFTALDTSHEHDGGIALGEQFNSAEINHAETMKVGDPKLADIPAYIIAHILRKEGVKAEASDEIRQPLHLRKKIRRGAINKLVRRIAIASDPENPQYSQVWMEIRRRFGIKDIDDLMDNHDISKMDQIVEFLKAYIGGPVEAA